MLRTVLDSVTLTITCPLGWSDGELSETLKRLDRSDWKNRVSRYAAQAAISLVPELSVTLLPDPGLE